MKRPGNPKIKSPILIVEDNEADRELLKISFEEAGIENIVVLAENGNVAFDLLKKGGLSPFLIISDINMPGLNGLDLKEKINGDDDLIEKAIPFIFMTSAAGTEDIKRAFRLSAQGYFQKRDLTRQTALLKRIINYWAESEVPDSFGI